MSVQAAECSFPISAAMRANCSVNNHLLSLWCDSAFMWCRGVACIVDNKWLALSPVVPF